MTNGPTQVASSFIEAMKGQPLALAMAVMNIGLLGYLYYAGVQAHDERREEMKMLYENRQFVAKLLAECQPVPREQH
jgi:hypothetical protein